MANQIKPHLCTYQNCEHYIEHTTTEKKEKQSGPISDGVANVAQKIFTGFATAKSLVTGNTPIKD